MFYDVINVQQEFARCIKLFPIKFPLYSKLLPSRSKLSVALNLFWRGELNFDKNFVEIHLGDDFLNSVQ